MKKTLLILMAVILLAVNTTASFAATAKKQGPKGENPCSGDGVPDGSCFPEE